MNRGAPPTDTTTVCRNEHAVTVRNKNAATNRAKTTTADARMRANLVFMARYPENALLLFKFGLAMAKVTPSPPEEAPQGGVIAGLALGHCA